jgi:chorismate mutase
VAADDADEIREATGALITEMMARNDLHAHDLVSMILTCTPDLRAVFPAEGARLIGLTEVPLLCAMEMDVPGALPRVIRILIHAESDLPAAAITHVYLRGAEVLRQDLHRG